MTDQAGPDYNAELQRQLRATRNAQALADGYKALVDRLRGENESLKRERDELKEQIGTLDSVCPHCGIHIPNLRDLHIYSSEGYGEMPCPQCAVVIGVWEQEETRYHCQPARSLRAALTPGAAGDTDKSTEG